MKEFHHEALADASIRSNRYAIATKYPDFQDVVGYFAESLQNIRANIQLNKPVPVRTMATFARI